MITMSALDAIRLLKHGGSLRDARVEGRLDIPSMAGRAGSDISTPLRLSDCEFEDFFSPAVVYLEPVLWDGCTFRRIQIDTGVHFTRGLTCRDCEFLSEVLLDSGGTSSPEAPLVFERVKFHRLVDFSDSHFGGPVALRDVDFAEGTNLMAASRMRVSFDIPPVIERVTGPLDLARSLVSKAGEGHVLGTNGRWRSGESTLGD